MTLPQWKRLEIRLEPKTLSRQYHCPSDRDFMYLTGQERHFEFAVEKSPTETHILVPDYISANTLYLFNEALEFIGMGGYRLDQKSKMKIFELKKLKAGTYQVFLSSAASKTKLGNWWGMTVIVQNAGIKGPIRKELNENNALKLREYTFDLIDGDPQYLFVTPTKAAPGFNTNLMTLPAKNHQARLKMPVGFPVTLVSSTHKINGKNRYSVPAQGGFYQLNLSKN